MKFLQKYVVFLFLFSLKNFQADSINLSPNDEAQYGSFFHDKNNILTVSPDEFSRNTNENNLKPTTNFNEKKLDPSFKAIMQDITDNSHFLTADSKEESNFFANNQENAYKKQLEDSVNREISEIAKESREESLRAQTQGIQEEMYSNENAFKQKNHKNSNLLKQARFLEKESSTGAGPLIYDPTGLGII